MTLLRLTRSWLTMATATREQLPVPLGDDIDDAVGHPDGGLVVARLRRTPNASSVPSGWLPPTKSSPIRGSSPCCRAEATPSATWAFAVGCCLRYALYARSTPAFVPVASQSHAGSVQAWYHHRNRLRRPGRLGRWWSFVQTIGHWSLLTDVPVQYHAHMR
jgi:hypothetical protein